MNKQQIPEQVAFYKDQSLTYRHQERWADLPGLEEYFSISNHGRVIRKRRISMDALGRKFTTAQKIIVPAINKSPNFLKNDYTYRFQVSLRLKRKTFSFQTQRMVYYCFVSPFDLNDKRIVISVKEGNGLDIRPENLIKMSLEEKVQRAFSSGRQQKTFAYAVEHRKHAVTASTAVTSIKVSRYGLNGKKIKTYKSQMEGKNDTGTAYFKIRASIKSGEPTADGFYWRLGDADFIDPTQSLPPASSVKDNQPIAIKLPHTTETTKNLTTEIPVKPQIKIEKEFTYNGLSAHRDKSLNNRAGEAWLPVPGYENELLISNHGRVKKLASFVNGKFTGKETIILPHVTTSHNKYLNETNLTLQLGTMINKKRIYFQVHRMVYHCFVKPFDLNDRFVVIGIKGNRLNIRPDQLFMTTQRERTHQTYELGRQQSLISQDLSILLTLKADNPEQLIPVSQYDASGKRLCTFDNVVAASDRTGIPIKQIRYCAKWLVCLTRGYYWHYGSEKAIDVKLIKNIMARKDVHTIPDAYQIYKDSIAK